LLQRSFVCCTLILASLSGRHCSAQSAPGGDAAPDPSLAETVQQLQEQVKELRSIVADLRSESQQYRAESRELREELHSAIAQLPAANRPQPVQVAQTASGTPDQEASNPQESQARLTKLEEEYDLLTGKIDDQYQTKVESRSKYKVRLSGLVLMDLFSNRGGVLNSDVPGQVDGDRDPLDRSNSTGISLRQSQIGLEVFGPELAGAKTHGDLQADFSGGFQYAPNGVALGLFRLRTGTIHLDWPHTSIVAGQDAPFFSALSPTSFATLAEPALAEAGNLWMWIPQIRVERRMTISENSNLLLQGGILDGLTGEPPVYAYGRRPQAGEYSRQPGYAGRVALSYNIFGEPLTLGAGAYYSRQNWGFGRNIDAWAGTLDWSVPLGKILGLSGELYRGQGLGGLGGGSYQSALFSGSPTDPASRVQGLDSVGGWAQLKVRASSKVEFNFAGGQDNPFASEIREFPFSQYGSGGGRGPAARNQSGLFNVIYRPRSDLVLSAEYGHIATYQIDNSRYTADRFSLVMGILF
jgi:regulator of replication initiation timing